LIFAGDLCLALGLTLAEISAMSAAEFSFWRLYAEQRGFPVDRLEAAIALSGAAVCRANGKDIGAKDLIPKFGPGKIDNKVLAARLARLPGAKVTRRSRKPGQAQEVPSDDPPARERRHLNPKPKKPRKK
jgi:hypothetical protein